MGKFGHRSREMSPLPSYAPSAAPKQLSEMSLVNANIVNLHAV
jgi:hypothetical protein